VRTRSSSAPALRRPSAQDNRVAHQWHGLPIVVRQRSSLEILGLGGGSQADLEFHTPGGETMWAIAFVFAFPNDDVFEGWPICLSISL
jgi:hypothetical protein